MSRDRRRIPLYDVTAPIVCTLTAGEVQEPRELLAWLRSNLSEVERSEHGLLLHLVADPGVEEEVRRFVVAEQRCCAFWGFDVEATPTVVTLRWDAPPAADEIVEQLLAFLRGERADVSGLL